MLSPLNTLIPEKAADYALIRKYRSMPLVAIQPDELLLFSGSLEPGRPTSWLFYLEEWMGIRASSADGFSTAQTDLATHCPIT